MAQPCTGSITSFPYNEGFETNDGNWLPGGFSSDWAWGTPTKSVITGAGGGNNCWVTGGLTGSTYGNGENSWLMSPCFDFTSLTSPSISFKILWETEQRFDGASFQYSTDGGNNWTMLGDVASNSDCRGTNWYNTNAITYLGNVNGWTGNIQPNSGSCLGGNGSGAWLTAKHTLSMLAGQSNVRFRFVFGAGTTCNNFNGFAIDDISIGEAVPPPVSISSTCVSASQVQFSVTGTCIASYAWNFGDPGSGSSNTSSQAAPAHTFSAPGMYTVNLSAPSASGGTSTASIQVVVISASGSTNWPDPCSNIPSATLTVTATGSSSGYFYYWDTDPPQTTPSISNVGPGTYNVTVNALNACAASVQYVLGAATITNSVVATNSKCTADNGTITSTASGGSSPYTYTWSNGATGATVQNLAPGTYSVEAKDAGGCSAKTENIVITAEQTTLPVSLGPDMAICNNETLLLNPGSFDTYLWQDGTTAPTFRVTTAGTYSVQVKDANGCTGTDEIRIIQDCSDLYFPTAFTPDGNGRNDGFGPLGTQAPFAQNYRLNIYNRYGQLVFSSKDPLQKWNGTFKGGVPLNGSYVWMATYKLNGKERSVKGSILLIR